MSAGELDGAPELFDFVDQYLADVESGGARPLADYLGRFPEHVQAVTREYERLSRGSGGSGTPPGDGAGRWGGPGEGALVGPYRLLRQLARGGQGTVYLAEDTRIARRVALKILTTLFSSVPEARLRRLRREAEVISKLDHPGICGIFDADLEGPIPYLAMRYVEGETLADLLARSRERADQVPAGPPEVPARGPVCRPATERDLHRTLEFFEQTARALQAAHEAGVVHRDIKPGNLMVAEDGRPVLLDFGLAHDEDAASHLTQAGELFGTPAYMAPEQIVGRARADPRTDVYGLGVVLYECLALERPFDAPTRAALYHAVVTGAVSPIRAHHEFLPRALEVVLEKALEQDPARRYASASELGADLGRVRRRLPVGARAAGPLRRLRRWAERHPAVASGTFGVLLLLAGGLGVSLAFLRDLNAVNRLLRASVLGSKSLMLKDDDPTVALLLSIESADSGGGLTGNMALLASLGTCRERRTLSGHTDQILDAELVGERGWVITASADGSARVFELESGRLLARLAGHAGTVTSVAAAADPADPARTLVATGGTDGAVLLYRLPNDVDGEPPAPPAAVLGGHADWVRALAFDPAGELLASASNDGLLCLHRTRDGALARSIAAHAGAATQVAFSPDGTLLLSASGDPSLNTQPAQGVSDHTARLFAVGGGDAGPVLEHPDQVLDARFSPDGTRIATACEDGAVRVHGLDGTLQVALAQGQRAVASIWSPDGSHLIAIYAGSVQIWSACDGSLLRLRGPGELGARSAAFSPDGLRVVTGGLDNTAHVWDVASGAESATLTRTVSPIAECFWTPDGTRIVTSTKGRLTHVWYADPPPGIGVLKGHQGPISTVEFDPAGERVLSASLDGTARLWSRREGRLLRELRGHAGPVRSAAFDPSGERLVTASEDGTARVWDGDTGALLALLDERPGHVHWAGFAPDGDWIATLSTRRLALWSPAGELRAELDLGGDEALRGVFSADGRRLAILSSGSAPRVVSVPGGLPLARLATPGDGRAYDGCFVPGSAGGRFALASEDGFVRIWDVDEGAVVVEGAFAAPGLVDLDPSGTRMLVANRGGIAILVDSRFQGPHRFLGERPSRGEEAQPMAHDMQITVACFSPEGTLCMTASRDGTASLWNAATGAPVARFEDHAKGVLDACFSPDGAWVATGSRDGTVRIWPVDPLPIARARKPRELTPEERERYSGG